MIKKIALILAIVAFSSQFSVGAQSLRDILKKAVTVAEEIRQATGITVEDIAEQAGLQDLLSIAGTELRIIEKDTISRVARRHRRSASIAAVNSQQHFSKSLASGNYSGIAWLGGSSYALIDDKSSTDGFRLVDMDIDLSTGVILSVRDKGFISSGQSNRDGEGIVWVPESGTIFMSGEADNDIYEYSLDGKRTGRYIPTAEIFGKDGNYGLESLAYDSSSSTFWTTTESTLPSDGLSPQPGSDKGCRLRIQSYDSSLEPKRQWIYETDAPLCTSSDGNFVFGVSEICALGRNRLLVLERESFIPNKYLGAYVVNKLYEVHLRRGLFSDKILKKHLLLSFSSGMDITDRSFANYEGMCLGPELEDGSRVLIMVADSQGQYLGVLKDWFLTAKVRL